MLNKNIEEIKDVKEIENNIEKLKDKLQVVKDDRFVYTNNIDELLDAIITKLEIMMR
ncbi:MAG: hypothetical protein QW416_00615 [Candidatus Nitrosocaldaceae archaeon]